MAIRNILDSAQPALHKSCRAVTAFDEKLATLLDDMTETLKEADGVGLAAPQVGILRRAVIVEETNVAEGEDTFFLELVNPEIIASEGEQRGSEGCLSVPGVYGLVTRPATVTVKAQDRHGEWFTYTGEGLTARCFCHEVDHLDGVVFTDVAERILSDEELETGSWREEA